MRLNVRKMVLLASCLMLITSVSMASVITFDTLSGNAIAIPDGFAGFDWNNFYHMNLGSTFSNIPLNTAGVPDMHSFAYNNGGQVASFGSSGTFTFNSAWLVQTELAPLASRFLVSRTTGQSRIACS